jgi:protein-tyrosine phosphatase
MTQSPDIITRIDQPLTDATADRLPDGNYRLRWVSNAPLVALYGGFTPETMDRAAPLTFTTAGEHELRVGRPDPAQRPYFELQFADGRTVTVAERVLHLQGSVNLRDIGGYATRDGRTVRWGQVYRSGTLAELTEPDVAYLAGLGIRVSCDLRTAAEVDRFPDRLPAETAAWHLPVGGTVGRMRRIVTLIHKRNRLREVLQEAYTRVMVDQNGAVFGDLFRALADPARMPLLIHCTAGKDRTGVAVALLLAALSVDDETIAADYSLSSRYEAVFVRQMADDLQVLRRLGLSDEQLRAFFQADPATILGVLAHVRGRYGSVRDFLLRMGGVTPDVLQRVQDNLLT